MLVLHAPVAGKAAATGVECRGSTLVESVLVLLVFMSTLIALFDCSQFMFLHQTLVERVRAAARYGTVNTYSQTEIQNMVLYG